MLSISSWSHSSVAAPTHGQQPHGAHGEERDDLDQLLLGEKSQLLRREGPLEMSGEGHPELKTSRVVSAGPLSGKVGVGRGGRVDTFKNTIHVSFCIARYSSHLAVSNARLNDCSLPLRASSTVRNPPTPKGGSM